MAAVRAIVAEEFAARVSAVHAARVAPTVVALRTKAAKVVDAELARLAGRLAADHRTLDEVERAMRRVVDKLLHAPTVRVKELAGSPGGDAYEDALRVLFDLDPAVVAAVTLADSRCRRRQMRVATAAARTTREQAAAAARHPQEPDGHGPVRPGGPADHRAHRGQVELVG